MKKIVVEIISVIAQNFCCDNILIYSVTQHCLPLQICMEILNDRM